MPAVVDIPTGQVVTNDFRGSPTTSSSSGATTTGPTRPTCGPTTSATRWTTSWSGSTRRSTTASTAAGSPGPREAYGRGVRPPVRDPGLARGAAHRPPLSHGESITEADVRLFTTLARFDAVYHGHFGATATKLVEMPAPVGLRARPLPDPGFGDNTDFEQIKRHYYVVQKDINPPGRAEGPGPVGLADAARPRAAVDRAGVSCCGTVASRRELPGERHAGSPGDRRCACDVRNVLEGALTRDRTHVLIDVDAVVLRPELLAVGARLVTRWHRRRVKSRGRSPVGVRRSQVRPCLLSRPRCCIRCWLRWRRSSPRWPRLRRGRPGVPGHRGEGGGAAGLSAGIDRLEELRMRVLAVADDVAAQAGGARCGGVVGPPRPP